MATATQLKTSILSAPRRLPGVKNLLGRLGKRRLSKNGEAILDLDEETINAIASGIGPAAATKSEAASEPTVHWAEWRINLMERLWGKGFLLPGGTEFISELTKPLSLGSKTTILVLGAGMGGPSNLIANEFGAFIDGIEPDPELAQASAKRAAIVKGISRVTIKNLTIDDDAAFDRKYDAIFGQEILLHRADIKKFLNLCASGLKDNGKLVITDFTSPDNVADGAIDAWLKREGTVSPTLNESDLRTLFKDAGFRMRTVEDLTDRYVGLVLDGWVALEESLRANTANRDILLGMIEEAERWAVRVAMLKNDQIGYTRLFATKKKQF